MKQDPILDLQAKINSQKQLITEIHKNENNSIELTMNGHFEITKLLIQSHVKHEMLEKDLPILISVSIKSISKKIHQILMDFQAANS
ncbi:MAG: hypothetical protein RL127_1732 [Bacteroidota bacterium]|jgi:hypothetical protein